MSSLLAAWAGLILALPAAAQTLTYPDKPGADSWFSDEAGIIRAEAGKRINEVCFPLWAQERVPLYVVTVTSLADHGAPGGTIEGYAASLFNAWGVGSERRNFGMLLLVSPGDRRARIELGAGWGLDHDAQARRVMDEQIVPRFKEGDMSGGIVAGVRGMDAMARGLRLPSPFLPKRVVIGWALGALLLLGIGISLVRQGRTGWGWALIVAAGTLLLWLLWALAKTSAASRSSSGGFGGGSSGGGGATGSW